MGWSDRLPFASLLGKTLISVTGKVGNDVVEFVVSEDEAYQLLHYQSCCEDVSIEDIVGDLTDLVGSPILMAEEVVHEGVNPEGVTIPEYQDCFTWSFYKLATIKGYVTIRWYGSSNGYYSETVDFERTIYPEKSPDYPSYTDTPPALPVLPSTFSSMGTRPTGSNMTSSEWESMLK